MLSGKSKAVFAYLAAQNGAVVPRDRLADLCWERSGPEQARQSLRQALSQLRRELPAGASECLVATPDHVQLIGLATDVSALERAAASSGSAEWTSALALVRGPFAADLETGSPGCDEWIQRERMRLGTMAADLLARLATHQLAEGSGDAAVEVARRLVAQDPIREDGHRLLIRALSETGRRAEALAQYKELERLLRTELSVLPDPATRALIEGLRDTPADMANAAQNAAARAAPAAPVRPKAPSVLEPDLGSGIPARTPADGERTVKTNRRSGLSRIAAVLALLSVPAAGGMAVWWLKQPQVVAGAPILVVKPFETLSSEPETAALARALATRLSGGLSAVPTIRVRSSETKGPAPELHVEGAVQAADGGALVTARLVRQSGEVLQQVEFKAPPRAAVEMQDEILGRVGRLITEKLDELAYPWTVSPAGGSQAMDMSLTARNLVNRGDTSDRVMELFRTALRQEPESLQIKARFGIALVAQALNSGLPRNRQQDILNEATRLLGEVERAAPHLQLILYGRCQASRALADMQAARVVCERARTVMPWSARVYKELGYTMLLLGVLDQADGYFQAAERLERLGTIRWTWAVGAGATALLRNQHEPAGNWFQIAATLRPNTRWYYLFQAVAARRGGNEDAVKTHLARFRALPETTSLDDYFDSFFPNTITYPSAMREGLMVLKKDMAELM
ncbi:MAG: BTAD domain-containing putative transcriptional regulator, partial [Bosea sp. (in: a-proteobacteria)]